MQHMNMSHKEQWTRGANEDVSQTNESDQSKSMCESEDPMLNLEGGLAGNTLTMVLLLLSLLC